MLKCNREVTWISRQRPCVYTSVTEVKYSYKPSVCLSCVELLRSCGTNNLVAVSDIPVFCLDYKLPTTLNIRTCNSDISVPNMINDYPMEPS